MECIHEPFRDVRHMYNYPNHHILQQFMCRHDEWLVMTKVKHQFVLNKPMIVRRTFTKAWDGILYPIFYPGITALGGPSTFGSRGLMP